jgi:LysM repeat protein
MNETRHDKGSVPSVIAAYRKRQERAIRLLVISWIGVMLFVLGAGYLVYRFMSPGNTQQAEVITGTPTIMETAAPGTIALSPTSATAAEVLDQTETPAASATPAGPRLISYTVQEGDTMVSIAVQHGVGLADLTALNPLVTPEFLSVGDQLAIPVQGGSIPTSTPGSTSPQTLLEYQVVSGDTLAAIAARLGSTVDAIVRENNLASPDQIFVGQTLRIPVEVGAAITPALDTTDTISETVVIPTQEN